MEIKGPGRVEQGSLRRVSKADSESESVFHASEAGEPPRAQTVTGPGPIAAVESILVLQELDDSTGGRSKGVAHGEQLLEMLDQFADPALFGDAPELARLIEDLAASGLIEVHP